MIAGKDELRVLLLPAESGELMLPAAAVAEIVRAGDLALPDPGSPPWLAGTMEWRGLRVPVARLAEPELGLRGRLHAVVCYAPSADPRLPFLAVESAGLPQLARVGAESLAPEEGERPTSPPFVLTPLSINGRPAWLMDLDALEASLLD
jgi:chemosensory pili system protein ChpC